MYCGFLAGDFCRFAEQNGAGIIRIFRFQDGGDFAGAIGRHRHPKLRRMLLNRLKLHQVFDVAVGIQIIDGAPVSPDDVELLFVEHDKNLIHQIGIREHLQTIGILAVEQ